MGGFFFCFFLPILLPDFGLLGLCSVYFWSKGLGWSCSYFLWLFGCLCYSKISIQAGDLQAFSALTMVWSGTKSDSCPSGLSSACSVLAVVDCFWIPIQALQQLGNSCGSEGQNLRFPLAVGFLPSLFFCRLQLRLGAGTETPLHSWGPRHPTAACFCDCFLFWNTTPGGRSPSQSALDLWPGLGTSWHLFPHPAHGAPTWVWTHPLGLVPCCFGGWHAWYHPPGQMLASVNKEPVSSWWPRWDKYLRQSDFFLGFLHQASVWCIL